MILSIIAEATECDFKREVEKQKPVSWLKSVSAYANGIGGTLLFGVDDNRKIIGLKNLQEDADFISRKIKDVIMPLPKFSLTPYTEDGQEILALVVKSGRNTPYYFSDKGTKRAYVRIGSESVIAPDYVLNELILKGTNRTFDTTATDHKKTAYSFTLLEATYRQRAKLPFEDSDYKSFGLVNDDGTLTFAGALFTDQHIIYNSRLFCTRWNGLDMGSIFDDALDDKEYEGNLIFLLQSGCEFVKNNTKVRFAKEAMARVDKPDYAERAVMETIVNALIHRDWTIPGSEVHINIYDDRLEISSPGGMYNGKIIQEQNIYDLESERRNPILADLFHRMKYMERRGSGLKKIVNETKKLPGYNENFLPQFSSTVSSFKVVLKNVNYADVQESNAEDLPSGFGTNFGLNFGIKFGLNEVQENIIKIIYANPSVKAQAIADELGLTRRSIEAHISKLKKAGLIEREGAKKTGRWIVRMEETETQ